jgi:hypothetical protein
MPLGVPGRQAERELVSNNGTTGFTPSNNIIRIPLNVNSMIDTQLSFLKFEFTLTLPDDSSAQGLNCPNKDVVFEGGCWSIFDRCQVLGSDGSTIEDMQNYNLLYNMLMKCSTSLVWSQVMMQALAGAPGMATNPVPAVGHGADMAVPFNPRGRHSQTKSLTLSLTGIGAPAKIHWNYDPAAASSVFDNPKAPLIGPLVDLAVSGYTADDQATPLGAIEARTTLSNFKPKYECSIESAGPEQWFGYFAGLGVGGMQNALENSYEAYQTGFVTNDDQGTPFYDAGTVATLTGSAHEAAPFIAATKFKPSRCFNRGAIGVSGVQGATPAYNNKLTDSISAYTYGQRDAVTAGNCNYNSRSNPLSIPSWAGSNHNRVLKAMGTTVTSATHNASLVNKIISINSTEARQAKARKGVMARHLPAHSWGAVTDAADDHKYPKFDGSDDPSEYDATAELAYNDWFAFQHTSVRACGPQQLISDGTSNPCPLISYVGSDGQGSKTDLVIRYDKAKTKGCQNLSDRLLLGHAPSNILFDETVENRNYNTTFDSVNAARAQTIKRTFMMPLLSGLLNNPKYLPAQFISGGGIMLVMHLSTNAFVPLRIVADQPTRLEEPCTSGFNHLSWKVDNPVYRAHTLNFEDTLNANFAQAIKNGGILWNGQSWRAHNTNFSTTTSGVTLDITERVTSLKAIFACFRPQAYTDGNARLLQVNSLSSYRCGIKEYQWRLGAVNYPDQAVPVEPFDYASQYPAYPFPKTDIHNATSGGLQAVDFGDHYDNKTEALAQNTCVGYFELMKAFGKISNVNAQFNFLIEDYERECKIAGKQGNIYYGSTSKMASNWALESSFSPYDCEFQGGMFVVALATEAYQQDIGVIQSGVNTAANAINIQLVLKKTEAATSATVNVTIFTLFDQVYALTPQGTLAVTS